jgi:hypothetical protein
MIKCLAQPRNDIDNCSSKDNPRRRWFTGRTSAIIKCLAVGTYCHQQEPTTDVECIIFHSLTRQQPKHRISLFPLEDRTQYMVSRWRKSNANGASKINKSIIMKLIPSQSRGVWLIGLHKSWYVNWSYNGSCNRSRGKDRLYYTYKAYGMTMANILRWRWVK